LGKVFSTNRVLEDYFDDYKTRISDRLYHPLKTFDSVAKFKRHIVLILQKWLNDPLIRQQLISQSLAYSRHINKEQAESDIVEKINYITDMYEQLSTMISEIDLKHSEYTKSSTTKILYLNNTDKNIKGHLESIFKLYAKNASIGEPIGNILSQMQDSITLQEAGYIDTDSLTLPVVRKYREEGEPLPLVNFDEVSDILMQGFLDQTRNSFTDERIFAFMKTAFGDREMIHINEIPLPDYDAFILLILATVRQVEKTCFYDLKVEEGRIIHAGYILPNFSFIRKGLTPNV
jgi:hypothetical protein